MKYNAISIGQFPENNAIGLFKFFSIKIGHNNYRCPMKIGRYYISRYQQTIIILYLFCFFIFCPFYRIFLTYNNKNNNINNLYLRKCVPTYNNRYLYCTTEKFTIYTCWYYKYLKYYNDNTVYE